VDVPLEAERVDEIFGFGTRSFVKLCQETME
jgi:hypothetical protein